MTTTAPHAATLDILERLVAFPTVSTASNLELIGYVQNLLTGSGFRTQRLPDQTGTKAGLLARLGDDGPGGILLSAHSDVVPVVGQEWSGAPFRLRWRDERLFGRGTTDMKGFLASTLAMAQRATKARPDQPLMMAISYDEEVGCLGIRQMLPDIKALGWTPELCIVGEPTNMRPAIGHKGKAMMTATCRGTAGHSSLAPCYANALHLAAEFIAALRGLQESYAASSVKDDSYDIPYSTVHAGWMQGGTALNIVPDHARIEFEFRHLPGDDVEGFRIRVQEEAKGIIQRLSYSNDEAGIEVRMTNSYPGLEIARDHKAVRRVAELSGQEETIKVAYGTEAGFFSQFGIPTVVCGPGDMAGQGHKANEYLAVSQLAACDRMMDRLLAQVV